MMPKISVRPAANRNSNSPSCRPFRHCSKKSSMVGSPRVIGTAQRDGGADDAAAVPRAMRSLHRALARLRVLPVLDGGLDGLERQHAVGILHRFLNVEVLDRELVV